RSRSFSASLSVSVSRTTLSRGTSGAVEDGDFRPSSFPKIVTNSAPPTIGIRSSRNCTSLVRGGLPFSEVSFAGVPRFDSSEESESVRGRSLAGAPTLVESALTRSCEAVWAEELKHQSATQRIKSAGRKVISNSLTDLSGAASNIQLSRTFQMERCSDSVFKSNFEILYRRPGNEQRSCQPLTLFWRTCGNFFLLGFGIGGSGPARLFEQSNSVMNWHRKI